MKNGLVIGKFMPLHKGHIALVQYSACRCDKLYVAVCTRDFEPIQGSLRFNWAKESFKDIPNVEVIHVTASLPDAPFSSESVSKAWADYFKYLESSGVIEEIGIVFSSELYGPIFAKCLGADHVMFDHEREENHVSATAIRNQPIKYWDEIAPCARTHFSKKICVYGSESTGKSTLTKNLASKYETAFVHETACDLFPDRHCEYSDMERVAPRHFSSVTNQLKLSNKLLFVDTDLIITQVYSQKYFNKVPQNVIDYQRMESYDGYIFCDIDVPWVNENFRDLGHIRPFMRDWFLNELLIRKISPFMICGDWEDRMNMAMTAVTAISRQPFIPHNFIE